MRRNEKGIDQILHEFISSKVLKVSCSQFFHEICIPSVLFKIRKQKVGPEFSLN